MTATPYYPEVVVEVIGVPPVVGVARTIMALHEHGASEEVLDTFLHEAGTEAFTQLDTIQRWVQIVGSHT